MIDDFTLGKTLGKGFSATVKLARKANDDQEYALKIIKSSPEALLYFEDEVAAMEKLQHENIVRYFGSKRDAIWRKESGKEVRVCYIVFEVLPNGDLHDLVTECGFFGERKTRALARVIMQAYHAMNVKGMANRDLKLENILIDKEFNLKIVDFGFATTIGGSTGSGWNQSVLGTPSYMAPEIHLKKSYQGQVTDLFAIGVIIFMLYTGKMPFVTATEQDSFYSLIMHRRWDIFWRAHEQNKPAGFFSESFKDLIVNMLSFQPYERLSISEVAMHPWIQD
jgi:serine/threonine protein kinase